MARLQPVRGTHDILEIKARTFDYIVSHFKAVAERYGHGEISTPIFEFTEVFKRTLGETSDVVTKEMYTFEDRSGEQLTLRPEYTAGIARAFISGGMQQLAPCKFYAYGPMFRYERPQKGRMRQFHQIDAEILGVPEPQADVELLAMAADFLREIGLLDRVTLEINSLGDVESRQAYRDALVVYFQEYKDQLSQDSQERLDRNPLRILDSKNEGDKAIVANAPSIQDYLNEESRLFFSAVCQGLELLDIPYTVNERLVRGLDYYSHTAFEFTTTELGAQGTVLAGGRYDKLIEQMGGPATAGIGWAGGLERLAELVTAEHMPEAHRPVAIIPMGGLAQVKAMKLAHDLRLQGFHIEMGYRGNLGKRLKRANKANAVAAILMGEDEMARRVVTVRNLDSGEQQEVALSDVAQALQPYR
ncbi:MAG: histidine--tRNA ligase [Kordiimonas sp.]|nr:histidine--tRNA ligase [Kordiimonas sp.]